MGEITSYSRFSAIILDDDGWDDETGGTGPRSALVAAAVRHGELSDCC